MRVERVSRVVNSVSKVAFAERISSLYIEKLVKIEVLNDVVRSTDVDSREVWMMIESCGIDMSDLIQSMTLKELNDQMPVPKKAFWIFCIEKTSSWASINAKSHSIFRIQCSSMLTSDSIAEVINRLSELKTSTFKDWVKWDEWEGKIMRIILFFIQWAIHEIVIWLSYLS